MVCESFTQGFGKLLMGVKISHGEHRDSLAKMALKDAEYCQGGSSSQMFPYCTLSGALKNAIFFQLVV